MKHKIFALGALLICMLSLAACGNSVNYNTVAGSRYDENVFSKEGAEKAGNAMHILR